MKILRALLVLGRVSNLPTIWSNCLCGWLIGVGYAGIGPVDWSMLYWLCAGASAIYLGGMYLNDACDIAFDRQFRKERPIPSGVISEGAVWKIGIGLLAAGVGVLSLQGGTTALLALALFNCVLIYNFLHKKIVWSPLLIALCRFFLLLVAASFAFATTNPDGSFFAHQRTDPAVPAPAGLATWTALALCLYISGLSCFAKVESESGVARYWPCILLCSPVLLALFVNPSGENRKDALLVSVILGLWVLRCLRFAFRKEKRDVGKTVGGLLAGISLVDLLAVPLVSPELAGLFLGCFLLSLMAQRWVPAT